MTVAPQQCRCCCDTNNYRVVPLSNVPMWGKFDRSRPRSKFVVYSAHCFFCHCFLIALPFNTAEQNFQDIAANTLPPIFFPSPGWSNRGPAMYPTSHAPVFLSFDAEISRTAPCCFAVSDIKRAVGARRLFLPDMDMATPTHVIECPRFCRYTGGRSTSPSALAVQPGDR